MNKDNATSVFGEYNCDILEARKIALEILARAEQERLQFAEAEARRGIDWESNNRS